MSVGEQLVYARLLLVGFINSEFEDGMYANKDFVKRKVEAIHAMNPV